MRKISMYVVAAFLILTGVGVWTASTTQAQVQAPTTAERIDPSRTMINVPDLPTEEHTVVLPR